MENIVWQQAIEKLLGLTLGKWVVMNPYKDINGKRILEPNLIIKRVFNSCTLRYFEKRIHKFYRSLLNKETVWNDLFRNISITKEFIMDGPFIKEATVYFTFNLIDDSLKAPIKINTFTYVQDNQNQLLVKSKVLTEMTAKQEFAYKLDLLITRYFYKLKNV